jgi:tRNA pseudouridine55 synthase
MDGLLIIDKPEGITSHDVVARVRSILKTKRVGHTGTLDPFATGVLVLLIGKATRLAQFIDKDEKEYEAVIQFGFETDTGDRTGMRNAECRMRNEEIAECLQAADWEAVLSEFRGEIEQVPPMYSAKKVAGKKLYELARQGKEIERKPVKVIIRELDIIGDRAFRTPHSALRIRVVCSAGTYIRTLAEDIGRRIGAGAHLTELRRTRAGRFDLSDAHSIEALEADTRSLIPLEAAVEHLPAFILPSDRVERTRNGLATHTYGFATGEIVRMLGPERALIAIGRYDSEMSEIKPSLVIG